MRPSRTGLAFRGLCQAISQQIFRRNNAQTAQPVRKEKNGNGWYEKLIKIKEQGQRLFDPNFGGSYAVFDDCPFSETIQSYFIQNVFLSTWALGTLLPEFGKQEMDEYTRCYTGSYQSITRLAFQRQGTVNGTQSVVRLANDTRSSKAISTKFT